MSLLTNKLTMINYHQQDSRMHDRLDYFSIQTEDIFHFHQEEIPGSRFINRNRIDNELTNDFEQRLLKAEPTKNIKDVQALANEVYGTEKDYPVAV